MKGDANTTGFLHVEIDLIDFISAVLIDRVLSVYSRARISRLNVFLTFRRVRMAWLTGYYRIPFLLSVLFERFWDSNEATPFHCRHCCMITKRTLTKIPDATMKKGR